MFCSIFCASLEVLHLVAVSVQVNPMFMAAHTFSHSPKVLDNHICFFYTMTTHCVVGSNDSLNCS